MLIIIGSSRISSTFPASLAAVIVVSVIVYIGQLNVPTIGTLPDSLPAPRLPVIRLDLLIELAPAACAVALLAAIESLLSARVAAGMPGQGSYAPDRVGGVKDWLLSDLECLGVCQQPELLHVLLST